MTRQDIFAAYTIDDNGIIQTLGKFEGEMLYAPYYYDAMMNGDGETEGDEGDYVTWFDVEDVDLAEFPELGNAKRVSLYTSEQGFVYVNTYGLKVKPIPTMVQE